MGLDWDSSAMNGVVGWGDSGGSSGGGWFDSIYNAGSSVFGAIGSAANSLGKWSQENYGGAMILGTTIGAAGNYITQKSADKAAAKREKEQFDRENKRYDELHQVADLQWQDPTMDAGTLAGNAPLTNDGLLSTMQQNPTDYTKKKAEV